MKTLLGSLLALVLASNAAAATTRNDDGCDIALLPAATLLVPYFEVDVDDPNGDTTLFTVTNVTAKDQIAHVTLWTDRAYPVIGFNIYLTGYDVQSINLYDVIGRGVIAPPDGTGTDLSDRGDYSDGNPALDLTNCDRLPGVIDNSYVARMVQAFTEGDVPAVGAFAGCDAAGGVHENAIGYATINVLRRCSYLAGNEPEYWRDEILWDNVLMGDYQQVTRTNRLSEGGPLVHIRAVPEGGTAQQRRDDPAAWDAGFPRTFYSRYQPPSEPRFDGRQPLPSAFAARWIRSDGSTAFQTHFKIWREGRTGAGSDCAAHTAEKDLHAREVVMFDEAENAVTGLPQCNCTFEPAPYIFPPASLTTVTDVDRYPQHPDDPIAGWAYLNLQRPDQEGYATQGWVISSMRAEGQFSVDMDVVALGNGCSAPAEESEVGGGTAVIGPP